MFVHDSAYPVLLLVKILTCSTSGGVVVERPARNIAVLQLCFKARCFEFVEITLTKYHIYHSMSKMPF